jgi:hypothetical protein
MPAPERLLRKKLGDAMLEFVVRIMKMAVADREAAVVTTLPPRWLHHRRQFYHLSGDVRFQA